MNTEQLIYQENGVEMHGHLALPDGDGKAPGLLVFHAWQGQADFERAYAERLAKQGYVALAADVYGEGKNGTSTEENAALMTPFIENRGLLRARAGAALEALRAHERVDASRMGGLGFCFGGLTVLELVRGGSDLRSVAAFHALLKRGDAVTVDSITPSVLVMNGTDDPMVPAEDVTAFKQEMNQANADWQFVDYGNAQHAFTKPSANNPELGMVYNEKAANRSWRLLLDFLQETLS